MVKVMCGILLGGLLAAAGCTDTKPERLNAPPQGHSDAQSDLRDNDTYMVDNAMLSEMSMSPCHFIPNTSELTTTGVRRLTRYASILKTYGGTLHYDGLDDEEKLGKNRMEQIREFLVSAGLGADAFQVELGVAGGPGLNATEVSEINKGTSATPASVQIGVADVKQSAYQPNSGK